jgi:hypothetical protein
MLKLRGKVFDTVATIVHEMPYMVATPTLNDMENQARNSREIKAWNDSCWELAKALGEYPTGENISDAYWRTLVFNTEHLGLEAPPDLELSFKAWTSIFATHIEVYEVGRQVHQIEGDNTSPKPPSTWGWIEGFSNRIATKGRRLILVTKLLWKLTIAMEQAKAGERFTEAFKRYSFGRKFCTTANGYIGWASSEAQIDDRLCYFEGCPLPFVIRGCEGGYELVGDCYIHGLMHQPPRGLDMSAMELITLI